MTVPCRRQLVVVLASLGFGCGESLPGTCEDDRSFVARGEVDLRLGTQLARLEGDGGEPPMVLASMPGQMWGTGKVAVLSAEGARVGTLVGDTPWQRVGAGLAVGDVDGDGRPEVLIGGQQGGEHDDPAGHAWLLSGPLPAGEVQLDDVARAVVHSETAEVGAYVGIHEGVIAGSGPTLVVSVDQTLRVFDGSVQGELSPDDAVATIHTGQRYARSGNRSLLSVDRDGDGVAKLLLTGRTASGSALYAVALPVGGEVDLDPADAVLDGVSVASMASGDLTGDGRQEVVLGANADPRGELYLWQASEPAPSLALAPASGRRLGSAVEVLGDLDGDGYDELAVGLAGSPEVRGQVWLFAGPVGPTLTDDDAVWRWEGERGDEAGAALLGGDLTGDGLADLLIGAPGAYAAQHRTVYTPDPEGAVHLIPGCAITW